MDTSKQLYEQEATGWKRGVYEDIKQTFRAPIVNWVFRTWMANYPAFLRYVWGQLKPVFQTRSFARLSVNYREAILTEVEASFEVPSYRRTDVDVRPAEFSELRGQVATFDVVAPRLAILFELTDRLLHDEPVGETLDESRAATEPFPDWLDRDRGAPPTMASSSDIPESLDDVTNELQQFHGLDGQLASVHRCLAQWPGYFERAWTDLRPILHDEAFESGTDQMEKLVDDFVTSMPYHPRLSPDDLRQRGTDEEVIDGAKQLVEQFNRGPAHGVVQTLPLYAATVDVAGPRTLP